MGYILYVLCIHNSNLGLGLQAPIIHEWEWDKRKLKTQTRIQFWPATIITSMPQVKIQFLKVKMFSPRLILYFLCLLALISLACFTVYNVAARLKICKRYFFFCMFVHQKGSWSQAFLAQTIETGDKNYGMTQTMHRKLRKD